MNNIKLILVVILSTIGIQVIQSQVAITERDKTLLLDPNLLNNVTKGVIDFYISNYQEKLNELENELLELETEKGKKRKILRMKESIENDKMIYAEYLAYWIETRDAYRPKYDKEKCYVIETDKGIKDVEEINILEEEKPREVVEQLEISTEKKMGWVKKKKSPGCFSQNPKDCYVMCYEVISESKTIHLDGISFDIEAIPNNYTYKKNENLLVKKYEVIEIERKFIDPENKKVLDSNSLKEKECK